MFVGWEFGEYFWEAMLDAGARSGSRRLVPASRPPRSDGGGRMIGLLKKHRYFRSHDLRASYDAS